MSESLPHDLPPLIIRYRWRLHIGTAIGVVVVGVALGMGWFYFLRAPGPQTVCEHVAWMRRHYPQQSRGLEEAVAPRAVSGAPRPVNHSTDQQCTWFFTTEQKQRGFLEYGRLARCVAFAETPQELYPCLD